MLCNYAKCDTMIREKLKEKILTMSDAQQNALLLAAREIIIHCKQIACDAGVPGNE